VAAIFQGKSFISIAATMRVGLIQVLAPMGIISFLDQVPAVVWSGLLASLVTLSGVMLSNRSNTKRLLQQLEHDATQKNKDRIAVLHREVYLKAAEELARASGFLGTISQLDPAKQNIAQGLSEFFAVSAKVQLIAQPTTSRLAGELTLRYGELIMRLIQKVMPVHDLNSQIRLTNDFAQRNQAEVDRVLAEMKQLNESGVSDRARFEALERSFHHAQEMTNSFATKRESLWAQQVSANREFNITLFQEMREVGPVQTQVMAALRSELGLETNVQEYQQRMEENWARMDMQLRAVLDQLAES
jgi:hypothetical protein